MRSLLLSAFFVLVCVSCGPAYVEVAPMPPPAVYPGYVFTYPNGCWADDIWYAAPCRWPTGPNFGYYWYGSNRYTYVPHRHWEYHPRRPPPREWRPPVIRDHRPRGRHR